MTKHAAAVSRCRAQVVQLEELLQIRHCVFVMGPPGAGKSQSWKVRELLLNTAFNDPEAFGRRSATFGYITTVCCVQLC